MNNIHYREYKAKLLENPEFRSAYDDLELPYRIIRELVRLRIESNMTQYELAERTGIPKSNISRFENGKHIPSLQMIERIAAGLGMKLEWSLKRE